MHDLLFFIFSAWTLGAAAMVVMCRRPVYAALGLGLSSLGTAALCALLAAPFLAASQALIYGGTAGLVCAVLFAALVVPPSGISQRAYGAAALGVALFILLARFLFAYRDPVDGADGVASAALGGLLFGEYALAMYMVALILLAALLSIAVLVRNEVAEGEGG